VPSPYWNTQLAPLNQGLGNFAQGLARLPIARAQGAMLSARAGTYQAQGQEDAARTALLSGQLEHLQSGDKAVDAAAKASADYLRSLQVYQDNPTPENLKALEDSTSTVGGAMSSAQESGNPKIITQAFQNIMSLNQSVGGNTGTAANIANPVAMQENVNDNAEKAGRPVTVPSGGTLMTPGGGVLGAGGVTLNQGQQRFGPQGNLTAGMMAPSGGPQTPPGDDMGDQTPQTPGMVASVPPAPPKPDKPQASPFTSPEVVTAYYKSLIDAGTNAPDALNLTKAMAGTKIPSGAANSATAPTLPTINTQDDYDALAPGSQYVDSFGRTATKLGK